jgi:hypothetical protein
VKLQIKTIAGQLLFESEAGSLRELILGAVAFGANLYGANLSRADLSGADLSGANLYGAGLYGADLSGANLYGADLYGADLSGANLSRADLSGANLSRADLSRANLSGAKGLTQIDVIDWFRANFKKTSRGVIVYKCFHGSYSPNPAWEIKPGSVIAENCNPNPTEECGCGVNFATLAWVKREHPGKTAWRCLIPWAWLPGVVIPWNTDGKARCSRLILLREEK